MLTLTETKLHLRVDQADEDSLIQSMMDAATAATADYLNMPLDQLTTTVPSPIKAAAAAAVSEVTTRIRLRYRPGLTTTDRVNHEGTIYGITSVIDYKSGNRELVLMCRG